MRSQWPLSFCWCIAVTLTDMWSALWGHKVLMSYSEESIWNQVVGKELDNLEVSCHSFTPVGWCWLSWIRWSRLATYPGRFPVKQEIGLFQQSGSGKEPSRASCGIDLGPQQLHYGTPSEEQKECLLLILQARKWNTQKRERRCLSVMIFCGIRVGQLKIIIDWLF